MSPYVSRAAPSSRTSAAAREPSRLLRPPGARLAETRVAGRSATEPRGPRRRPLQVAPRRHTAPLCEGRCGSPSHADHGGPVRPGRHSASRTTARCDRPPSRPATERGGPLRLAPRVAWPRGEHRSPRPWTHEVVPAWHPRVSSESLRDPAPLDPTAPIVRPPRHRARRGGEGSPPHRHPERAPRPRDALLSGPGGCVGQLLDRTRLNPRPVCAVPWRWGQRRCAVAPRRSARRELLARVALAVGAVGQQAP